MITDWRLYKGIEWRVIADGDDGCANWLSDNGKSTVQLKPNGSDKQPMNVYIEAEAVDGEPVIEIWSRDATLELLGEDERQVVVNAVSLSTQPIVNFKNQNL